MIRRPPRSTLFPYTRSSDLSGCATTSAGRCSTAENAFHTRLDLLRHLRARPTTRSESVRVFVLPQGVGVVGLGFRCSLEQERSESTRLNSSHSQISYAVFCL